MRDHGEVPACFLPPPGIDGWTTNELILMEVTALVGSQPIDVRYAVQYLPPPEGEPGSRRLLVTVLSGPRDAGTAWSNLPCRPDAPGWSCTTLDGSPATLGSKLECRQHAGAPETTAPPAAAVPRDPRLGTWVSENPAQPWHSLFALWGAAKNDAWAVGGAGTLLRYDGARWQPYPGPVQADLLAISGSGFRDVWAVGQHGAAMHWDGAAWRAAPVAQGANLDQLFAPAPEDAWAGSSSTGELFRWQAGAWKAIDPGLRVWRLFGTSERDVWVFDPSGALARFDGNRWTHSQPPLGVPVVALARVSPRHVVAAGSGGTIARFDGELWWHERNGTGGSIEQLWAPRRDVVWAFNSRQTWLRWFNGRWATSPIPEGAAGVRAAWGLAADDGWVIDSRGAMFQYDGKQWSQRSAGSPPSPVVELVTATAIIGGAPWVVGSGVMRLTPAGWASQPVPPGLQVEELAGVPQTLVQSIAGSSENDVWAVTHARHTWGERADATVWHFDGTEWRADASAPKTARVLWQRGRDDVWAAGDLEAVWHRTNSRWIQVDPGAKRDFPSDLRAYAITSDGAGGVWVAGDGPFKRCTTRGCTSYPSPIEGSEIIPFLAISTVSATQAYAVVGDPHLENAPLHGQEREDVEPSFAEWDGVRWKALDLGPVPMMLGAVAAGRGELWALGAGNKILHLKEGKLERMVLDDVETLSLITRTPDGVIRLVGDGGRVMRRAP